MKSTNQCFVILSLLAATTWEVNSLPPVTGSRMEFAISGSILTSYVVANTSSRYVPSVNPTTWDKAVNECAELGLTLVDILSKDEADELRGTFQDEDFSAEYWIGGIFNGTPNCLSGTGYDNDCWYWRGNNQSIDRVEIGLEFSNQNVKPSRFSRVVYIPDGRNTRFEIEGVTALKRFVCERR